MPRLLLAALLAALVMPAAASAAAPTCPIDEPGFGTVTGIGPQHVLAGVPERPAGALAAAGAIVVREGRRTPRTITLARVPGAGAPVAGDRFGAALGTGLLERRDSCADTVAGAPGRNGSGEVFLLSVARRLRPRRTYRQGARGVLGRAEAGDRFGAALASGASLRCQEDSAIAVGVPGEDFRGMRDPGAVALLELDPAIGCRSRELIQGRGLSGRAHSGERTGATLGIAPDRPGLDEDTFDTLLVGVPSGEILTTNAGHSPSPTRLSAPPNAPGYGSVFALPSS